MERRDDEPRACVRARVRGDDACEERVITELFIYLDDNAPPFLSSLVSV